MAGDCFLFFFWGGSFVYHREEACNKEHDVIPVGIENTLCMGPWLEENEH